MDCYCPDCGSQQLMEQTLEFYENSPTAPDIASRRVTEVFCAECGWYRFIEDEILTSPAWVIMLSGPAS